ncbi:MAG: hypothetical protein WCD79_05715 [Chthoniobacteraceae bacterium]
MKILPISFLIALVFAFSQLHAQDTNALPFAVSVGGQAATYKAGDTFARVAKSVKNDAAIEVTTTGAMTIINVNKTNENGEPAAGGTPAVILLQGTNKGTLAGTMDKQKLAPGSYLMSVVADGKTASILFTIE